MDVPPQVSSDLGPLLERLLALGLSVKGSDFDARSFGDYHVDLAGTRGVMRLCRDRGQFLIDGDVEQLKRLGSFRAFDSKDEFTVAVLQYAQTVA